MSNDVPVVQEALSLRAICKLGFILLASAVLMPLQWLLMRFTRGRAAFVVPRWWFACLRRALGIRVEVVGMPRSGGGTLFVGNHVSHYDIVLLGGVLQARFIAKDDMTRWPGMGFVGELAQTVYISRRQRDAAAVAAALAAQLRADHDLVLFPEGTTSSGERVAPFKSSLFALFLGQGAQAWTLQPFTQELVSVDGRALSAGGDRAAYAFHGDMDAGAHVKHFLNLSGAAVRLTFHPPIQIDPDADRKTLALQLHDIVASALPTHGDAPPPARD
ncbi:lysophospholipid acyltransferase family protein [Pseudoxanthomonas sp. GM95]|uniref:lysophospholipid acyltransferase family protein n=1 Tax=Pseudoxanthomonas sp. GM95 TaxID=1881043 RepID=UPI000B885283|nr:lysophospholipid acyltransferase family protein [Pseudoxanthomonas sp. GM95]